MILEKCSYLFKITLIFIEGKNNISPDVYLGTGSPDLAPLFCLFFFLCYWHYTFVN